MSKIYQYSAIEKLAILLNLKWVSQYSKGLQKGMTVVSQLWQKWRQGIAHFYWAEKS